MIRSLIVFFRLCAALVGLTALAQAQSIGQVWSFTSATAGAKAAVLTVAPIFHTVQVTVTGSPAACSLRLEGSLDGANWYDISGDQDCTTGVMFHSAYRPVSYVRANLTGLTGGTSPTVTARYLGVR